MTELTATTLQTPHVKIVVQKTDEPGQWLLLATPLEQNRTFRQPIVLEARLGKHSKRYTLMLMRR